MNIGGEGMYQSEERQRNIQKVIQTAQDLFLKYGVLEVSINRIAKESGLSAMSLYRYFGTREDLILSVWKSSLNEFYSLFMRDYNRRIVNCKNGFEKFQKCMGTYVETYTKHPEWYEYTREMFVRFAGRQANDKDFWDKFYSWIPNPALNAMLEGQKDGSVKPDVNVYEAYQLIYNAYTGTNITQHFTEDVKPMDIIQFTTELLESYIRNDSGQKSD